MSTTAVVSMCCAAIRIGSAISFGSWT